MPAVVELLDISCDSDHRTTNYSVTNMFDLRKRCPILRRHKACNDLTKLETANQKANGASNADNCWAARKPATNYPCVQEIFQMEQHTPGRPVSFIVGAEDEYASDSY